jgi:excisionase family DNA binding protein
VGAISVTNSEMSAARLAFRVIEAATLIGVSAAFLRLELARGNLSATRLGRRIVLTRVELDRYLGSRQSPSSTAGSAASSQSNSDARISSAKPQRATGRERKRNVEAEGRATANGKAR